jgi:hypothetical protein
MSCSYSFTGQLLDCKDSAGGVKEVYIIDNGYVTGYTFSGNTEVISAIYLTAGQTFKTYQLRKQVASLNTTVTTNDQAGTTFYQTDLVFSIPRLNASKRLELKALSVGNMSVIVRDNNDDYWGLGFGSVVTLNAGSANTGINFGDANGYQYTLQQIDKIPPFFIDPSCLTAILDSNVSLPLPS